MDENIAGLKLGQSYSLNQGIELQNGKALVIGFDYVEEVDDRKLLRCVKNQTCTDTKIDFPTFEGGHPYGWSKC